MAEELTVASAHCGEGGFLYGGKRCFTLPKGTSVQLTPWVGLAKWNTEESFSCPCFL